MGRKEYLEFLDAEVSQKPVYLTKEDLKGVAVESAMKLSPILDCFEKRDNKDESEVVYSPDGLEIRLRYKLDPDSFVAAGKISDDFLITNDKNIFNPYVADESSLNEILDKEMEEKGFTNPKTDSVL